MGNFKSKPRLISIIDRWEKADPDGLEYKTHTNIKKALIIHRLNGEYFIESGYATIGPMSKDQLLMISRKNEIDNLKTIKAASISNINSMPIQETKAGGDIKSQPECDNTIVSNVLNEHIYNQEKSEKCSEPIPKNDEMTISSFRKRKKKEIRIFNVSFLQSALNDNINKRDPKRMRKIQDTVAKVKNKNNCLSSREAMRNLINNGNVNNVTAYENLKPKLFFKFTTHPNHNLSMKLKKLKLKKYENYAKNKKKLNFNENTNCDIEELDKDLSQNEYLGDNTIMQFNDLTLTTSKSFRLNKTKKSSFKFPNNSICEKNVEYPRDDDDVTMNWNSTYNNHSGLSEIIKNELYCFSALANYALNDWNRLKSIMIRLQKGFDQKYKCIVKLSDEQITYRGNKYFTVKIEGPELFSVIKCRNSLPNKLRNSLIVTNTNTISIDKLMHDRFISKRIIVSRPNLITKRY